MSSSQTSGTRVTIDGKDHHGHDQVAVAALCAAVERAVQAHRPAGMRVREVVVMLEEAGAAAGSLEPAPVFVDVYDSGYGHGI